jgi:hypothetical protein
MKNADKTHCPKGHPYNAENTRFGINKNGKPKRQCRQCQRDLETRIRKAIKARRDREANG